MTTIIADRREGIMVSDNQDTFGNVRVISRKVYRIATGPNKGTLVGVAGQKGLASVFLKWYEHDFLEDPETVEVEDFTCLFLTPKRKILLTDGFYRPEEVEEKYFAIGSGGDIALGAMDAGATAEEAVEIACKRDTYTSRMGRKLRVEKV